MPLDRRLPKRGFVNIFATRYTEVRLDRIARSARTATCSDAAALKERGVIRKIGRDGDQGPRERRDRHQGHGAANKFTASAQSKIEAAGGKIELVGGPAPDA
jgi:large subunit ribosomal protein L15